MRASRLAALLAACVIWTLMMTTQVRLRESLAVAHARLNDGVRRIAVLGDSVARGAGDERGRAGIAGRLGAANFGVDGARTRVVLDVLRRTDVGVSLRSADVVVVSIGGNDLFGDGAARLLTLLAPARAMERTINRVAAIVDRIHAVNPAARIVLLGLYNPYRTPFLDEQIALWDSRLIARFARDREVDVVRIADLFAYTARFSPIDHFHPSAEGYALIAARVAAAW
jgi:lysophospholipase L1-like esterase